MGVGGPFEDESRFDGGVRAEAVAIVRGGRLLFEGLSFSARGG